MPRQTPAPAPRPVRDWITIEETASHLGLTKVAVRNMIREGRLKAYRNGPRIVRLDRNEVDAARRRANGRLNSPLLQWFSDCMVR